MSKKIYSWDKVSTGDIISFRYPSKGVSRNVTVLVLNPKFKVKTGFHLIGLKLESQGSVPIIKNKGILEKLLSKLGKVRVVDFKDEIYKVVIGGADSKGAKKITYDKIKRQVEKYNIYRTYIYEKARKSQVFLEPIELPDSLIKELIS